MSRSHALGKMSGASEVDNDIFKCQDFSDEVRSASISSRAPTLLGVPDNTPPTRTDLTHFLMHVDVKLT